MLKYTGCLMAIIISTYCTAQDSEKIQHMLDSSDNVVTLVPGTYQIDETIRINMQKSQNLPWEGVKFEAAKPDIVMVEFWKKPDARRVVPAKLSGLQVDGKGLGGVTGIKTNVSAQLVLERTLVKGCAIGYDLEGIMNSSFIHCQATRNYDGIGMLIHPDLGGGGGGNANTFYSCEFYINEIAIKIDREESRWPLSMNTFIAPVIQGNGTPLIVKDARRTLLYNPHWEQNKEPILLDSSLVVSNSESWQKTRMINNAQLSITPGYGVGSISTDGSNCRVYPGAVFYGIQTTQADIMGLPLENGTSHAHGAAFPTPVLVDPTDWQTVQFEPRKGSTQSNRHLIDLPGLQPLKADEEFVVRIPVRLSPTTQSLNPAQLQMAVTGSSGQVYTTQWIKKEWRYINFVSNRKNVADRLRLYVFPNDDTGGTFDFGPVELAKGKIGDSRIKMQKILTER